MRCLLTWGHILHWYFLIPGPWAPGWPGWAGPGGPRPCPGNTLAPLMGCGTSTELETAPEAGGEDEADEYGLHGATGDE